MTTITIEQDLELKTTKFKNWKERVNFVYEHSLEEMELTVEEIKLAQKTRRDFKSDPNQFKRVVLE